VLRRVPSGALISSDGQRVLGTAMNLEPRRRHIVAVQAAGFEPWADTVIPREGQRITRTVRLRPLAQAAAPPQQAGQTAEPQVTPARLPAEQPTQRQSVPPTSAPANQTAAAPTGVAYLSVSSDPPSSIYINGRPVPFNPVQRFRVPAGEVHLRFTWTDAAGTWSYDTTVTAAVGQHRDLGRIVLARTR
jgi:hypothetical protein